MDYSSGQTRRPTAGRRSVRSPRRKGARPGTDRRCNDLPLSFAFPSGSCCNPINGIKGETSHVLCDSLDLLLPQVFPVEQSTYDVPSHVELKNLADDAQTTEVHRLLWWRRRKELPDCCGEKSKERPKRL